MELQREYTTTMMPPDFCPEILEGPEAQAALDRLVARFFPQEEKSPEPTTYGGGTRPSPVDDDDAALVRRVPDRRMDQRLQLDRRQDGVEGLEGVRHGGAGDAAADFQ